MGGRRKIEAWLCLCLLLLLTPSSFAGLIYAAPAPIPQEENGYPYLAEHAILDPVEVQLELFPLPRVGHPSQLGVHLASLWGDLSEVKVEFEASESLVLSKERTAPRNLPKGQSVPWDLSVLPVGWGPSRIALWVTGVSPDFGRLGGHAVIFLDVPPQGSGEVFYGNPAVRSPSGAAARMADFLASSRRGPSGHSPLLATDTSSVSGGVPSAGTPLPPQSHASFNVTGQWNYWLEDDATAAPQRRATVEVWDEDLAGSDDVLWTGMTDETGNFTSIALPRADPDGPGNQDVYVRFVACNGAVCVQTTDGTTYSWRTETVTVAMEDTIDFGARASAANQFAQRPFEYINNAWDYAANLGGLGALLGQVRVLIPGPCTFYTLGDDTIHLCADGVDDKSPDDVGHEYAHFVQDKMYGDAFWPSPGGVHTACGDGQNRGLSWTEGFADFFGPRAYREIVDPQDHFYNRPWNGTIFSFDLENSGFCPSTVEGDDNEMRVATSLWDLADDADDGLLDVGIRHPAAVLFGAINGCDQASYRAFYDGGRCNWVDRGNSRFDLLATAFQNTIDYNIEPLAQVTSPSAFEWARDTLAATAVATDPDTNVTSVEFQVSTSASCSGLDLPFGMDSSPPFAATLDVALLPDASDYWVCARAADEMEVGTWAVSASSVGVDSAPPASMAAVTGILGVDGWFATPVMVELQASDAISGVASISYRLDGGEVQLYGTPFEIRGDGIHTVAFFAMDVAGNVENVQPLLVLIDTGPPIIQILRPTPGAYVGQSTVSLAWSVTDAGAGVKACAVSLDGAPSVSVAGDTAFAFADVADGPHRAAVTCEDQVDRVAEVEVRFTVDTNPFSVTGPFGPTLIMGIVGLGLLLVALLLRRRR